jgi:hypothetical protein
LFLIFKTHLIIPPESFSRTEQMPLVRLQVRNVYGLGQKELHTKVDREDPKAILDDVAVSGLVGILRQLGDLTEFAAEIFHGIQEEVMITASRSNKLKMRLKQIEAKVPTIQKTVLAQTNHIHFAYTGGFFCLVSLVNLLYCLDSHVCSLIKNLYPVEFIVGPSSHAFCTNFLA